MTNPPPASEQDLTPAEIADAAAAMEAILEREKWLGIPVSVSAARISR